MVRLNYTRAQTADIPEIIALAEKTWLPGFARYFKEDELNSLFSGMYNSQKIRADLARTDYEFYFVKNEAKESIGYFAIERKETVLKLDKIYVDPSLQRTGLGKVIYAHIKTSAADRSFSKIVLNVNRRNSSAIRFYEKLGFTILREVDVPGPNGFIYDDYEMEASL